MTATLKPTRHHGLDLLRILSMGLIVLLHECVYGGLLARSTGKTDIPSILIWFVYALTYVAVNCYVLISGYFQCTQTFKPSRLLKVATIVWFYSFGITAFRVIIGAEEFSVYQIFVHLFPISFDQYWFIGSYVGLCLLTPFLNQFIHSITKKQHFILVVVMLFLLGLWRDILPTIYSPVFDNATYSLALFIGLYFIAAYIRLYVDTQKIKGTVWVYLGCSTFATLVWFVLTWVYTNIMDLSAVVPANYYFYNNSTLTIVGAVALFIAFLNMRICNRHAIKFIATCAPLTLGVYAIHEHHSLRAPLWDTVMRTFPIEHDILMPIKAIVLAALLMAVMLCIDFVRAKLFALMERSNWYKKMADKLDVFVVSLGDKLFKKIGDV